MADYPYNSPPFGPPSTLFTTTDPAPPQGYFATAPSTTYPDPLQQQPSPVEYHFHYHYPPQQYFFNNMPSAKRVHWEDDVPRTPSPALSIGSATSSHGPITPETYTFSLPQVHDQYQPFQYGTHPEHFAAKPHPYPSPASGTSSPSTTSLHPLLAVSAFAHANSQPFVWNIATHPNELHPQTPLKSQPGYPIPPATLILPATAPPSAQLVITCALLPFEFVVTPGATFRQVFVTVGDVLMEIFSQLRRQVSRDEYDRLSHGVPHIRRNIDSAFFKRCEMLREGRAEEQSRGVRRVDLLMGSLLFAGLEMRSNGTAVLHVRPLA